MSLFLLIVISVYGAVNLYIFRRSFQALAAFPAARTVFVMVFLALVVAYPLGRFLFSQGKNSFSILMMQAGSYYIALMVNLFLCALAVDVVRLLDRWLRFLPRGLAARPGGTGLVIFLAAYGVSLLGVVAGALNAARPRLLVLELEIVKPAAVEGELKAAVASDIHLGTVFGAGRLKTIVEKITAFGPDIVLFPGDVIDESMTAKEEERLMAVLTGLKPPLGVFSVVGNHEVYSGLERNVAFLEKFGIRVLRDEAVLVNGSFYLVGRDDPSVGRVGGGRRPLREILESSRVDPGLPVILLDHQPVGLDEAERGGVDLQLSGHTHAGQLFPLDLINKRLYERNWGYLRKGRTHYYVSSGAGTWGPPVRTAGRSEIVLVRLKFKRGQASGEAGEVGR
jgi:hypothetical protein